MNNKDQTENYRCAYCEKRKKGPRNTISINNMKFQFCNDCMYLVTLAGAAKVMLEKRGREANEQ